MNNEILNTMIWDEHGLPRSTAFDDQYFCKELGYEEALYVVCQGNDLRGRFSRLDPAVKGEFTFIETGFGTGLDFCCVWQLWAECAPPSWALHFISVELYPLAVEELVRALSLWPVLARQSRELAAQYRPPVSRGQGAGGIGNYLFADTRTRLTIVFDQVVPALAAIREKNLAPQGADAWSLDGFAPSRNPEMWSDAVFAGMAALSRTGTTLATFTVAGFVRRGLTARGFTVQRILGHGKKKNVLTGCFRTASGE
ncbi:MAG: tRNA (5-methylaminomethyl-2-thiouridine)(34)-methyltransferase MnmD [Candidatus Omnitrophica bacterium]|nr:tRNA (5-methylaminomethyl-2-thiouridine)(34)-methyltransferase MnmD [Candidatus Omnitrophota bacterium]